MGKYSVIKTPMEIRMALAERHRALRKQQGWTQAETAERAAVSLGSLKRFEQTGKISLEHLIALAQIHRRLTDFDKVFFVEEDLDEIFDRLTRD